MHMADALTGPAVACSLYACSAIAAGYSIREVRLENDTKKTPLMGVMGAFVFATQMINFTIPGTGSSGHLCGGMLLTALLGPYAAFLTMIGVLLIQCLLFADGGLLALGCNIWNMAFYGCFVGAALFWKPFMRRGMSRSRIILASILGCIVTLQLGAFSVTLETLLSGITELPFITFVAAMQPIHLAIGVVEGLITATVLVFVYETRPELLYCSPDEAEHKGVFSFKKVLLILSIITVVTGGMLSLAASSYPDGLEWSIEKITGATQVQQTGVIYDSFEAMQEATALLPDYSFRNVQTPLGTAFSGIVGAVVVAVICVGVGRIFKFFRKSDRHHLS